MTKYFKPCLQSTKVTDILTKCLLEKKDKVPSTDQFSGQIEIFIMVSN